MWESAGIGGLNELLWACAPVLALAYAVYSCRRSALDPRSMYWAGVCACLGGLFGGHLMGLLVHGWPSGPFAWLRFWDSSKSYYGGLTGGAVALIVFCRLRRLPVLSYADACTPAVALGSAVGRIGCFLNGDDYGTVTHSHWAVVYPPGTEAYQAHLERGWISAGDAWSLPIHPVQLYASLLGVALFLALANWRPRREGARLCAYLVIYGVSRFFMEYLRGDFRSVLGPFSLPQMFSAVFVLVGSGIWIYFVRGQNRQLSTRTSEPSANLAQAAAP
jgi:phosphatidylglycerol:prolipoprotein diacylglycerol transferase